MFHTFEIATNINEKRMQRILRHTSGWQQQTDNTGNIPNRIITYDYALQGVSSLRIIQTGDDYYRFKVRWNPAVILDGYGAFRTVTAAEVRDAAEVLDELLREICHISFKPSISWFPSRIDFAIDIETPHVDLFTDRFGLARTLPHHRNGLPAGAIGSFYRGCKSVWMNFYAKQAELISSGASEEAIKAAANILRIEVQSSRNNLKSIGEKYHVPKDQILEHFLSDDLARQIILSYYGRIIGFEDFYKIHYATLRLTGKKVKGVKLRNLKNSMRAIEVAGGVSEARDQAVSGIILPNGYTYSCCKSTFNSRVRELRHYGINPIPLPVSYICNIVHNPLKVFLGAGNRELPCLAS